VPKSQGSGFDWVYLVLPKTQRPVVTREIIYTDTTRARSSVTVQGGPQTFVLGSNAQVKRSSALAEHLGWPPAQE
jgi:exodeoxyribonuclease V alpha subunit